MVYLSKFTSNKNMYLKFKDFFFKTKFGMNLYPMQFIKKKFYSLKKKKFYGPHFTAQFPLSSTSLASLHESPT